MPFSSENNPSKANALRVKARKEATREGAKKSYGKRKAEEWAMGVTEGAPKCVDLVVSPPTRKKTNLKKQVDVNEIRTQMAAGFTQHKVGLSLGVSQGTISKKLNARPSKKKGRPAKHGEDVVEAVLTGRRADPFGRNKDVAKFVRLEIGARLNEKEVSRIVNNQPGVITRATSRYCEFSEKVWDMHMGWAEGVQAALADKGNGIEKRNLFYQDEFPLHYGLAAKTVRSAEPVFAEEANGKKGAGCLNVLATIGLEGVVKVWVTKQNVCTNHNVFSDYAIGCSGHIPQARVDPRTWEVDVCTGGTLIEEIKKVGVEKPILLLDRLGRSGRAAAPNKSHYSPAVKKAFLDAGIGYDLLPPKGAEFNPIECFNGWVQRYALRWRPPDNRIDTYGQVVRGPRTRAEALMALQDALKALKEKKHKKLFGHWYKRRVTGSDAYDRWMASGDARDLLEKRMNNPDRMVYDLVNRPWRQNLLCGDPHHDPDGDKGDDDPRFAEALPADIEDDDPNNDDARTIADVLADVLAGAGERVEVAAESQMEDVAAETLANLNSPRTSSRRHKPRNYRHLATIGRLDTSDEEEEEEAPEREEDFGRAEGVRQVRGYSDSEESESEE